MTLIRTIQETFTSERSPAVPLARLNQRVRSLGTACSPDTIRRELRAAPTPDLRMLDAADPLLEKVASACPDTVRPTGLDALVLADGDRGLRPTPEDAVRVLGRALGPRDRRVRARWVQMLRQLDETG